MEGLAVSHNILYIDTATPRVSIGTINYTGGVPNTALWVSSNVVISSGPTGSNNNIVLYSTGSICLNGGCVTSLTSVSGGISQIAYCVFTGTGTSTTVIQDDDTIPQNTEGVQIYTCSITPESASSTLIIQAVTQIASETNNVVYVCLFQDTTANALACSETSNNGGGGVGGGGSNVVAYSKVSGTTSAVTFKIRGGSYSSGGGTAWGWNVKGYDGSSKLGFTRTSAMTITEVAP